MQSVEGETKQPWHAQPVFGPFAFYDVAGKVRCHHVHLSVAPCASTTLPNSCCF